MPARATDRGPRTLRLALPLRRSRWSRLRPWSFLSRRLRLLEAPRLVGADGRQLAQVVAVPVDAGEAPVELEDVRPRRQQVQDLLQSEGPAPVGGPQGVEDGAHERVIFRVVDGEAVRHRQVAAGLPAHVAETEALRPVPDEWR